MGDMTSKVTKCFEAALEKIIQEVRSMHQTVLSNLIPSETFDVAVEGKSLNSLL